MVNWSGLRLVCDDIIGVPHLQSLPSSTLTHLDCHATIDAWRTAAVELVNLKSLHMNFDYNDVWLTKRPLMPIQAPLEELVLDTSFRDSVSFRETFVEALFPSSHQSPLPSSLTFLKLRGSAYHGLSMTICPLLPRQLKSLVLNGMLEWTSSISASEPQTPSATVRQLLGSLPSGLKRLSLEDTISTSKPTEVEMDALRSLPQGLLSLDLRRCFSFLREPIDQMALCLPPMLVHFKLPHFSAKMIRF